MPMHDWTRVTAGTYHDFHCSWLTEIKNRLNRGALPAEYYAQVEQVAGGMIADILTLRSSPPEREAEEQAGEGGLAVAVAPPQVRITDSLEVDLYFARGRSLCGPGATHCHPP